MYFFRFYTDGLSLSYIVHQHPCRSLCYMSKICKLSVVLNIGIKHAFPCINVCQVPREMLKTEAEGRGFQHFRGIWQTLMHWKTMFDRCYCINSTTMLKNYKKLPGTVFDLIAITLLIPTRTIHFYKNPRFRPWSSIEIFPTVSRVSRLHHFH